jgi:FixJ family two-component response regulator
MMTGIKEKASTAHIVIVEDDALVRESLSDCLESGGYSVQTFGSAEGFFGVEFGAKRGFPCRRHSLFDLRHKTSRR